MSSSSSSSSDTCTSRLTLLLLVYVVLVVHNLAAGSSPAAAPQAPGAGASCHGRYDDPYHHDDNKSVWARQVYGRNGYPLPHGRPARD